MEFRSLLGGRIVNELDTESGIERAEMEIETKTEGHLFRVVIINFSLHTFLSHLISFNFSFFSKHNECFHHHHQQQQQQQQLPRFVNGTFSR